MKLNIPGVKVASKPKQQQKKKSKKADFSAATRGKLCFSFDFGEYSTKLTVAKVAGKSVQIVKQLLIENREHIRSINEENLSEWRNKISKALSDNKLNPAGQIGVCSLNSRHYIARQIEIPYADEADLQGLAAYELAQSLELDMDENIFQHKVLSTYEKNGKTMCTVWAAAVPKSLCQNYFNLLTSLKLKPMLMDLHVNGLESLLALDPALSAKTKDNSVAVIDYGLRNSEVYIFSGGSCLQTSNIDSGEGKLIAAAKNALGPHIVDIHNNNKLTVPPQEIYEIIRDADKSETAAVFADVVQKWIAEINNVVRRFNIDHPGRQIKNVFLYGGSQQLPWLKAYLEKLIGLPVEIMNGANCFKSVSSPEELPKYLNSAAILLRRSGGNECNFFEGIGSSTHTRISKISPAKIALVFGGLVLVCGLFYGYHAFRGFMMEKQLKQLEDWNNNPVLLKQYAANMQIQGLMGDADKDEAFLSMLIANTGLSDTANIYLLRLIDSCVGEDGTIRNISVNNNMIKIQLEKEGSDTVEDVQQITSVERRFRDSGYFDSVLVGQINFKEIVEDEKETKEGNEQERETRPESTEEEEREIVNGIFTYDITLVLAGGAIHEEQ